MNNNDGSGAGCLVVILLAFLLIQCTRISNLESEKSSLKDKVESLESDIEKLRNR